ncbi:MAG: hypothetical protein SCK70_11380, partial [bacterium]|nr:hypothetical protein [bacterium]
MKRIVLLTLMLATFWNPLLAAGAAEPAQFIVMRMDYQSFQIKYLFYFTQPVEFALPDSFENQHHDLYLHIVPAADFGETTIRSRFSGQMVY